MSKDKVVFKSKHDVKFVFEVSRVAEGNFKNLWQLRVQLPQDKEMIEEIDADSLSMIIDRIGYIFEQEGF